MIVKQLISLAASILTVAGWGFSSTQAMADARTIVVTIRVSTAGLDLTRAADVRKLYRRIEQAADVACTHGNKAGLAPVPDPRRCVEMSLGSAIRSVNSPLLTQAYLEKHTLQQADRVGLKASPQVAGR